MFTFMTVSEVELPDIVGLPVGVRFVMRGSVVVAGVSTGAAVVGATNLTTVKELLLPDCGVGRGRHFNDRRTILLR